MLNFESDYTDGAHPVILRRLMETNLEKLTGYGTDIYSERAREKIRAACECPEADVFFLVGGTQTNSIVISSMLSGWQGVIAAETGHIAVHEAGAIEAAGHKVLTLPARNGKISAEVLEAYLKGFYADANRDHMVFPGMVYISYPTEYGTLYTKKELEELHGICRAYDIPLYVDGARLGYGLMSSEAEFSLAGLAELCDVFYIGGTKAGALCGEAAVFPKKAPPHFMTTVKQRGALPAKGRLLGVQFDALFTDGLYLKLCRQAIESARKLRRTLHGNSCRFYLETPTNQQFVIFEDGQYQKLSERVRTSFWEKPDEAHTVVRFAVNWATEEDEIRELGEVLREII